MRTLALAKAHEHRKHARAQDAPRAPVSCAQASGLDHAAAAAQAQRLSEDGGWEVARGTRETAAGRRGGLINCSYFSNSHAILTGADESTHSTDAAPCSAAAIPKPLCKTRFQKPDAREMLGARRRTRRCDC